MADYRGYKKRQIAKWNIELSEEEIKELDIVIYDFLESTENEFRLALLSNHQRKYLHHVADSFGLVTVSRGPKKNRVIHISRKNKQHKENDITNVEKLCLKPLSEKYLMDSISHMEALLHRTENHIYRVPNYNHSSKNGEFVHPSRLHFCYRRIPPFPNKINSELFRQKKELPIYAFKYEILRMIDKNSVFILKGETGSGKSTQLPQYILYDAARRKRQCRIIVTQPRRIAAISVSQRVADERGENVGGTVGYHIRLEKCLNKFTNLIYTTSGCFLRSLMGNGKNLFDTITHLIIDEIHERDKYTDFTLITIKKLLETNKDLKIILMSATMDTDSLSKYFNNCQILDVPGKSYAVNNFYLEDILYSTGYTTNLMKIHLREDNIYNNLTELIQNESEQSNWQQNPFNNFAEIIDEESQLSFDALVSQLEERNNINNEHRIDEIIEIFDQLQYYLESEGMSIEIAHSITGITPLMLACKYNVLRYLRIFLHFSPAIHRTDKSGLTALHYASGHEDNQCLETLQRMNSRSNVQPSLEELKKARLLAAYQKDFNDDNVVDYDLLISLIEKLYRTEHSGGIIVFLPGYNEITTLRDYITSTLPVDTYIILILHSQMDTQDQINALQTYDVRKIILSTNLGQTSLTIPDLTYVIDSGKVKMNTYDSITESSKLQSVWISQADADQRSGRAGRTQNGVCFRIYTSERFRQMSAYNVPELMRVPLTEICLYAKTLDPKANVQTYLRRALTPPSSLSVQNAIRKLKVLKVFTADETVTDLGKHLVDFPLDVQLGICLLYGIFYRCIDSILTIVAFHSVKDPYVLPTDRSKQGHASFIKKSYASGSFSDHIGILNLYKKYKNVRSNKNAAREFCYDNYLSVASMELWFSTRHQINDILKNKFDCYLESKIFNDDLNLVRMCLMGGLYPNIAQLNRSKKMITCKENQLLLKPTSALIPHGKKQLKDCIDELPHNWVIYFEKTRWERLCNINYNTNLPTLLVALNCGFEHIIEEIKPPIEQQSCNSSEDSSSGSGSASGGCADIISNTTTTKTVMGMVTNKMNNLKLMMNEQENDDNALMKIDSWIMILLQKKHAHGIILLRTLLQKRFEAFISRRIIPQHISEIYLLKQFLDNEFVKKHKY